MNILFVEIFDLWPVHLEHSLELAQRHLDDHHDVTYIGCNAALSACTQNPTHDLRQCLTCMSRRKRGLKLLSKKVNYLNFSDIILSFNSMPQFKFNSIDELRTLQVDGVDIGEAVLSSVISIHRNASPSLEQIRQLAERLLWSSWRVYLKLRKHLETEKYDCVYVFNGRFAESRVALRLCQQLGVDCFVHERGADISKYSLCKNTYPHDMAYKVADIEHSWQSSDLSLDEKMSVAEEFYRTRRMGKEQSWYSFVASQDVEKLPESWDEAKKNIVIFTSSEDEFASIGGEWKNHIYIDQSQGIYEIISDLTKQSENTMVYIRMHPNTANDKSDNTKSIFTLNTDISEVITPESDVSTYALMDKADVVLSFGSTAGIEATFWGVPSVLAGKSLYRDLGGVYLPENHEQVVDMLLDDLIPMDKLGAVKYGYYFNSYGEEFKYYKAEGVGSGTFKGVSIEPNPLIPIFNKMFSLKIIKKIAKVFLDLHIKHLHDCKMKK